MHLDVKKMISILKKKRGFKNSLHSSRLDTFQYELANYEKKGETEMVNNFTNSKTNNYLSHPKPLNTKKRQ